MTSTSPFCGKPPLRYGRSVHLSALYLDLSLPVSRCLLFSPSKDGYAPKSLYPLRYVIVSTLPFFLSFCCYRFIIYFINLLRPLSELKVAKASSRSVQPHHIFVFIFLYEYIFICIYIYVCIYLWMRFSDQRHLCVSVFVHGQSRLMHVQFICMEAIWFLTVSFHEALFFSFFFFLLFFLCRRASQYDLSLFYLSL